MWYKNDTVALNWTQTNPATDTYFFRTLLGNQDASLLSTNQSIADQSECQGWRESDQADWESWARSGHESRLRRALLVIHRLWDEALGTTAG